MCKKLLNDIANLNKQRVENICAFVLSVIFDYVNRPGIILKEYNMFVL